MSEVSHKKRTEKLSIPFLDLTKAFPRSPGDQLAGLVHLPRMIDKARAKEMGLLGEYIFPCPLDERLLTFLGVKADKFTEAIMAIEDKNISKWTETACAKRTTEEKENFNKKFLAKKPNNEKSREKFYRIRDSIDPSRADIQTWAALIDLEEGRLSKVPSSSD